MQFFFIKVDNAVNSISSTLGTNPSGLAKIICYINFTLLGLSFFLYSFLLLQGGLEMWWENAYFPIILWVSSLLLYKPKMRFEWRTILLMFLSCFVVFLEPKTVVKVENSGILIFVYYVYFEVMSIKEISVKQEKQDSNTLEKGNLPLKRVDILPVMIILTCLRMVFLFECIYTQCSLDISPQYILNLRILGLFCILNSIALVCLHSVPRPPSKRKSRKLWWQTGLEKGVDRLN